MIAVSAPHNFDGHFHVTHGHKTVTSSEYRTDEAGHSKPQKPGIFSICIGGSGLFILVCISTRNHNSERECLLLILMNIIASVSQMHEGHGKGQTTTASHGHRTGHGHGEEGHGQNKVEKTGI